MDIIVKINCITIIITITKLTVINVKNSGIYFIAIILIVETACLSAKKIFTSANIAWLAPKIKLRM